jgi:hypothetical protein
MAYAAGCICMLLTRQHRRLGDLLAGTVLVREERIDLDKYTAASPAPAVGAAVGTEAATTSRALTPEEVELVLAFLARAPGLQPDVRRRMGEKLVDRVGGLSGDAREAVLASPERTEAFLRARARAEV